MSGTAVLMAILCLWAVGVTIRLGANSRCLRRLASGLGRLEKNADEASMTPDALANFKLLAQETVDSMTPDALANFKLLVQETVDSMTQDALADFKLLVQETVDSIRQGRWEDAQALANSLARKGGVGPLI